jgi:hypothetical protein
MAARVWALAAWAVRLVPFLLKVIFAQMYKFSFLVIFQGKEGLVVEVR